MNHTPSRKLERVRVQSIQSLPGRRKINPETVSRLVESIGKIGLRTPITIRYVNAAPVLVTGAHRLAAVQELGWDQVECFVFCAGGGDETLVTRGDDEITAKLWEISENLDRAELTPLERSELIADWIRLTGEEPSQVGTVSKGGRGKAGGINAAARELGISKTAAHRATKIAAIPEKAKQAARDAGLDRNQAALEKIAKADKPVDAVKAIISEPSKPKVDADEKRVGQWSKRDEETYAALLDAWAAASERAKAEFRKYIATDCGDLPQQIRDAMRALIDMGAADAVRSVVLYGAGLPEVKAGVHVPRKKAARKSSKAKPARGAMVRGTDPKTGETVICVDIPGVFS